MSRLEQLIAFHDKDDQDTFVTYGIAMEYAKTGDLTTTLQWLDKTLTLDPDYAYAWYQKAVTQSKADQFDAARQSIASGIEAAQRSGDGHAKEELNELLDNLEE